MSEILHNDTATETTEFIPDAADALDEALAGYAKIRTAEESISVDEPEAIEETDQPQQPADPEAPFGRFQNGKPRKRPAKNAPPSSLPSTLPASSLIDGGLLILLMDILFPLVIMFLHNRFAKAGKISVESLQLSDKQKADLKPVADAAAQRLTLQMNPVWLLVVSMGGIYGINYMTARLEAENQ